MKEKTDVVIVGAGPAGIFLMKTLAEAKVDCIILDKGKDINHRTRDDLLHGWGGAGAFSDGKLILSTEVGGNLLDILPIDYLEKLIKEVEKTFLYYGAEDKIFGSDPIKEKEIKKKALKAGLILVPMKLRHLGTEKCHEILKNMREDAKNWGKIYMEKEVKQIIVEKGVAKGVKGEWGEIEAKYVVLAIGRAETEWMVKEANRLGINIFPAPIDIGVRVEVPASILEDLTTSLYEAKFIYYTPTFDDKVRTFCMNPYGEVVLEKTNDLITVNGHSFASKRTELTNFAILVSTAFTEPFKDPIGYGKHIAKLANILGKTVIVQRLGDLLSGRRSTPKRIKRNLFQPSLKEATPGDLSFVLPYRILKDILEMLEALNTITPGLVNPSTLLYGVEVKFYSNRVELTENMETTTIKNLFIIGDGAGLTRGLVQAAASGIHAAKEIIRRK